MTLLALEKLRLRRAESLENPSSAALLTMKSKQIDICTSSISQNNTKLPGILAL